MSKKEKKAEKAETQEKPRVATRERRRGGEYEAGKRTPVREPTKSTTAAERRKEREA